jgi:[acyl-carrier-protein] S-malonyltransferase
VPLVSNVTASVVESTDDIKDTLAKQVYSPVLWEDSIRFMLNHGVDTFVEIGPGKVLSGFVRKICKGARIFNVEDIESLERTLREIT